MEVTFVVIGDGSSGINHVPGVSGAIKTVTTTVAKNTEYVCTVGGVNKGNGGDSSVVGPALNIVAEGGKLDNMPNVINYSVPSGQSIVIVTYPV